MAEEQQAAPATDSGDSGKSNKLVLIIALLNTLATVGVIVVLVLSYQKEKSKVTVDDVVAGHLKEGAAGHGGGHGEKAKDGKKGGGHGGGHGAAAGDEEEAADAGKIMPLDQFTINLTSTAGSNPRYLRVSMSLEFEPGQTEEEAKSRLARIRDTIINILNSKKAHEVAELEGREVLKDEIKRTINSFMVQTKVKNVYFTNFQITN